MRGDIVASDERLKRMVEDFGIGPFANRCPSGGGRSLVSQSKDDMSWSELGDAKISPQRGGLEGFLFSWDLRRHSPGRVLQLLYIV